MGFYAQLGYDTRMTELNDEKRVASARVLIIGAGLLGCITAEALVACGVRHFVLFDPASVNFRDMDGVRFGPDDVGAKYAAEVTASRLEAAGVSCTYQIAGAQRVGGWNFEAVLCCNASFNDRMAANTRVRQYGLALIDGVASGKRGRVQTVLQNGPCLGCLVTGRSSADPDMADISVIEDVAATMADEAMKVINGRLYECTAGVIHIEDGDRMVLNTGISPSCPFHREGKWQNSP